MVTSAGGRPSSLFTFESDKELALKANFPQMSVAMSAFAVFKRWPIAAWLFVIHAAFVLLIYLQWAMDSDVERGMIWMTVFILDWPSSYLFLDRPGKMGLFALSVIIIGGLQWALVGALLDLLRRFGKAKADRTGK